MRPIHHSGFRSAFVLLLFAGALAACGVKGDLERPPQASARTEATAAAAPSDPSAVGEAPRTSVYRSESRVQAGKRHTMEPRMPPDEWTKKNEEPSRADQKGSQRPSSSPARRENDRSFVLDWLL